MTNFKFTLKACEDNLAGFVFFVFNQLFFLFLKYTTTENAITPKSTPAYGTIESKSLDTFALENTATIA